MLAIALGLVVALGFFPYDAMGGLNVTADR